MATAMIVAAGVYCTAAVVGTLAAIVSTHPNVKIKRTATNIAAAAFVVTFFAAMAIIGLAAVSP